MHIAIIALALIGAAAVCNTERRYQRSLLRVCVSRYKTHKRTKELVRMTQLYCQNTI